MLDKESSLTDNNIILYCHPQSIQNIRIKNIFNYINNIMKNNFIRIIFYNISQSIKVNLSFSWFNRKKIQFPILFIIFWIEIKILSFISYLLNFNIEDFKSNLNFFTYRIQMSQKKIENKMSAMYQNYYQQNYYRSKKDLLLLRKNEYTHFTFSALRKSQLQFTWTSKNLYNAIFS